MKNVLITGGSRGIGKALVYEFSKKGYRVFLNYNSSQKEAEEISADTGAVIVKADISKSDEVKKMADYIHDNYGRIDVLINNAGIAEQKLFTDISENDWDRMFDINIKGMFLVTKAFVSDMIYKKSGKIINVSSMWGITGASCEVHYSASKSAVIGFTKALAKELGPSNICVNCIAPGVIETEMNKHLSKEDFD
ncbi:MAG: SDR family NAD(P)-dependent oxidoreductase, partial [Clostridia bacterium]|nr:SDR family NAD(P)-dependent oxidoreductase [Clostridia bacterium]